MMTTGMARCAAAAALAGGLCAGLALTRLDAQTPKRDPARPAAATTAAAAKPVRLDDKAPLKRTSGALPVFPPDARQHNIGGVVTMDVTVDVTGKVSGVRVLRSIPTLEAAASDAVRRWTYEPPPALPNGTKVPRIISVVFYFDAATTQVHEAQRIAAQGPQPRKTKSVPPATPAGSASRGGAPAQVVMEAVVDRAGKVVDVRLISGSTTYAAPAREAVKQWEYEPLVVSGVAVPFVLTITVLFH